MTDASVSAAALSKSLASLREAEPLIQHLTNRVTINDVANITLHWGALPVMADGPDDGPEMAQGASAVLLNTGQVNDSLSEAIYETGLAANELGVPVVLDPVGMGSTPTRNELVERLLADVDFAAIKGNYGEITALAGAEAEVRGVESVGEYDEIEDTAQAVAESADTVVVASGETDIVATADAVYRVDSGHEMMGEVVGTGCMLGGTVATFCGGVDDTLTAALHATLAFGLVGERAADIDYNGPASYRTNFLDSVWNLTPDAAGDIDDDLSERVERVE
ncbi:hydroxyethylthiazole kinase [Halonotius terrestris]|uniref:Hydroxyethylthiazole kinase n=1 Tax=Halonotius terrestris TaxID=2487750 RepID=A0A8J8PBY8_9EURY|nr:hydroxyethylthiazole kinase [Halonotius terrestris]TQQ83584.1 hydroxyethylthiazole kinase [Halonotius terrestris]